MKWKKKTQPKINTKTAQCRMSGWQCRRERYHRVLLCIVVAGRSSCTQTVYVSTMCCNWPRAPPFNGTHCPKVPLSTLLTRLLCDYKILFFSYCRNNKATIFLSRFFFFLYCYKWWFACETISFPLQLSNFVGPWGKNP